MYSVMSYTCGWLLDDKDIALSKQLALVDIVWSLCYKSEHFLGKMMC